jgi:hypothetical protein
MVAAGIDAKIKRRRVASDDVERMQNSLAIGWI